MTCSSTGEEKKHILFEKSQYSHSHDRFNSNLILHILLMHKQNNSLTSALSWEDETFSLQHLCLLLLEK